MFVLVLVELVVSYDSSGRLVPVPLCETVHQEIGHARPTIPIPRSFVPARLPSRLLLQ